MYTLLLHLTAPELIWETGHVNTPDRLPAAQTVPPKRVVLTLLAGALGLPHRERVPDEVLVSLAVGVRVLEPGRVHLRGRTLTTTDAAFLVGIAGTRRVLERVSRAVRRPAVTGLHVGGRRLDVRLRVERDAARQSLVHALELPAAGRPGTLRVVEAPPGARPPRGAVIATLLDQPDGRLFGGGTVERGVWVWWGAPLRNSGER
ncbi:hypothetical protein [Deinococcus pimensis]|uniref:hypothetical protein n=1 Tax=Deinococcus pimensis TaxID=309888 RepID=UPI000485FA3A|nr:hypothetical protein [Deinococcus pimensis]